MSRESRARARAIREDAERAAQGLAERIRARMTSDAVAHINVHLLGEPTGRTWCNKSVNAGIMIADTRPQATCEACIELDDARRIGLATGSYKHPLDQALDDRLGVHRPPTQGT